MQKSNVFVLAAASLVALSSCSKLGKLSADNFTVTPTPLEAIGGEVPVTINGNFPVKYMKKKAQVTVTPVLKYEGGESVGQSASFQGQKVEGNATTVSYKVGGTYAMKSTFAYVEPMIKSDLYARFDAKLGKKVVNIPEVKIGYGVLATSELLKRCNITAATAPDAYQRIIQQKQEANIKFLINQANLRSSELNTVSIKDLSAILKEINDNQEERALSSIEVSAYASPDGKFSLNEKLAEKRQDVSAAYMRQELKKIKMQADVDTKFTAEDWDGFQELVSKSNLQDKAVILRVLSMYQDPEQREEQISNMSAIYTDIKEGILPELRRARLIVNYEVIGRSDEQILAQFGTDPSKLSVEEMVYGANRLVKDNATRQQWYETIAKQYPSDYRSLNNLAQKAISEYNIEAAQAYLKKAQSVNKNAAEVNTNLAILALKSGDVKSAETYLAQGSSADTFKEVMGNLNIAKGNYTQAAADLAGVNTNSAALAQLLAKDYASAKATLANVKNADAITSYLKAIVAARTNDGASVAANLKDALQADPSLVKLAANDLEFVKYGNAIKGLIK